MEDLSDWMNNEKQKIVQKKKSIGGIIKNI